MRIAAAIACFALAACDHRAPAVAEVDLNVAASAAQADIANYAAARHRRGLMARPPATASTAVVR